MPKTQPGSLSHPTSERPKSSSEVHAASGSPDKNSKSEKTLQSEAGHKAQKHKKTSSPELPLPRATIDLIGDLVGGNGEHFLDDFVQHFGHRVSPRAVLAWLKILMIRGEPLTLQNVARLQIEQTRNAELKADPKRAARVARTVPENRVRCPDCGASIRTDHLAKHLRNRCPRRDEHFVSEPLPAALAQSHDEPSFGDKGLGQMRRESSGQFGSLPLDDDYGDEAAAE
jgi:predicted Zn-ribbon and HTH transcriptional regulator